MQGRVQPTVQMQGVNVNDDTSLETEADVMGWRAVQRPPLRANEKVVQMVRHRELFPHDMPAVDGVVPDYDINALTNYQLMDGIGAGAAITRNVSNDGAYHLGWNSIMAFTTNDNNNSFNFTGGKDGTNGVITALDNNNQRDQIVTRGVTGCSVIMVSHNKKHVMTHLDRDKLEDDKLDFMLASVPVPDANAPVLDENAAKERVIEHPNIFASIQDNPSTTQRPAKFVRDLIIRYYPDPPLTNERAKDENLVRYVTRGIPPGHNIRVLDRTADDRTFANAEIGLSIESGLQVFGSLDGFGIGNTKIFFRESNDFHIPMNAEQGGFDGLGNIGVENYREAGKQVTEFQRNGALAALQADERAACSCCYITTACVEYMGLADDCEELTILRGFRDNYLLKKENGKELIELYYRHAPQIVAGIRRRDDEEEILLRLYYDIIRQCVDAIKRNDYEYSLISKNKPMFSKQGSRNNLWSLNDNYLMFWFRFIFPNQSLIEMGKHEMLKAYIKQNYEQYSGLVLERYFREKLIESEDLTEIGNYWDKKGRNEIDIIALNRFSKKAIIAEVKRNPKKINLAQLANKVESIGEHLSGYEIEVRALSMEDV